MSEISVLFSEAYMLDDGLMVVVHNGVDEDSPVYSTLTIVAADGEVRSAAKHFANLADAEADVELITNS